MWTDVWARGRRIIDTGFDDVWPEGLYPGAGQAELCPPQVAWVLAMTAYLGLPAVSACKNLKVQFDFEKIMKREYK